MEQIIAVSMGISVGVALLLEVVKRTFTTLEVRFYPLIALALGVIVAVGTNYVPELEYGVSIPALILAGMLAGLSACGLYDLTARTFKKD